MVSNFKRSIVLVVVFLLTTMFGCTEPKKPSSTESGSTKIVAMLAAQLAKTTDSTELIIAGPKVAEILHQKHGIRTALPFNELLVSDEWDEKVRKNDGVIISMQLLNPYRDKGILPELWFKAFSAMFDIRHKEDGTITSRGLIFLGDKNGGGPYLRIRNPRIAFATVGDLMATIDESMLNLDALDQKVYRKWYGEHAMALRLER